MRNTNITQPTLSHLLQWTRRKLTTLGRAKVALEKLGILSAPAADCPRQRLEPVANRPVHKPPAMFSRFFTKVFCADASQNQRGPNVPSPPELLKQDAPAKDTSASDDARPSNPFSGAKKNVGTMEELHKKCKGTSGRPVHRKINEYTSCNNNRPLLQRCSRSPSRAPN